MSAKMTKFTKSRMGERSQGPSWTQQTVMRRLLHQLRRQRGRGANAIYSRRRGCLFMSLLQDDGGNDDNGLSGDDDRGE